MTSRKWHLDGFRNGVHVLCGVYEGPYALGDALHDVEYFHSKAEGTGMPWFFRLRSGTFV